MAGGSPKSQGRSRKSLYRRGFKTEANELVREVRSELDLSLIDPLDPWVLANHLGIQVIALSAFADDEPSAVRLLRYDITSAFSAATIFDGPRRLIVHNDGHLIERQRSDLSHEIGHSLLLHPPSPVRRPEDLQEWDRRLEAEAEWLGGALLVPDEGAFHAAREGWSVDDAAAHFGVTRKLITFRLRLTGAFVRVQRWKRSASSP